MKLQRMLLAATYLEAEAERDRVQRGLDRTDDARYVELLDLADELRAATRPAPITVDERIGAMVDDLVALVAEVNREQCYETAQTCQNALVVMDALRDALSSFSELDWPLVIEPEQDLEQVDDDGIPPAPAGLSIRGSGRQL